MVCANSGKSQEIFSIPHTPVDYHNCQWEKLRLNIMGPFKYQPVMQRFAVVMVEYHSKLLEVTFTGKVTTELVIKFMSVFA